MDDEFDVITKPMHYAGAYGVECKEAMRNMLDRDLSNSVVEMTPYAVYWWGCAFKYLYRFPFKNGIQDIKKCVECLENLEESVGGSLEEDRARPEV